MSNVSAVQQVINVLSSNNKEQPSSDPIDLLETFRQSFSFSTSSTTSEAEAGLSFDAALSSASASRDTDYSNRRDNPANVDISDSRRNDADLSNNSNEFKPKDSTNYNDDVKAGTSQPSDARDGSDGRAVENTSSDTTPATQASSSGNTQEAEANSAQDTEVGEAGELLENAKELLGQLEEFQNLNPELAAQLEALFAPLGQSLEKIIAQLSSLDASTPVTIGQLSGNIKDALLQLQQLANQFGQLQQGNSLASLSQDGQLLSDEAKSALEALRNLDSKLLGQINQLAENFRSLVTGGNNQSLDLRQASGITTETGLSQANTNPLQATQTGPSTQVNSQAEQALSQANVANNAGGAKAAEGQNSTQGDQTGQQQQQGFGNAQALLQQAARASANGSSSQVSTLGSSQTSNNGQANLSLVANQTTVTLNKNAANFEQVLKQTNRPSVSEQVQIQMKTMIKNSQTKMIVKLDPAELGQVEIRLEVNRTTKTQLVVNVERVETLQLLQRDARMLVQALQDAGLQADGGSLNFNLQGENQSSGGQQGKNIYPAKEENFDEDVLTVLSDSYTLEIDEGVNIHA